MVRSCSQGRAREFWRGRKSRNYRRFLPFLKADVLVGVNKVNLANPVPTMHGFWPQRKKIGLPNAVLSRCFVFRQRGRSYFFFLAAFFAVLAFLGAAFFAAFFLATVTSSEKHAASPVAGHQTRLGCSPTSWRALRHGWQSAGTGTPAGSSGASSEAVQKVTSCVGFLDRSVSGVSATNGFP